MGGPTHCGPPVGNRGIHSIFSRPALRSLQAELVAALRSFALTKACAGFLREAWRRLRIQRSTRRYVPKLKKSRVDLERQHPNKNHRSNDELDPSLSGCGPRRVQVHQVPDGFDSQVHPGPPPHKAFPPVSILFFIEDLQASRSTKSILNSALRPVTASTASKKRKGGVPRAAISISDQGP